MLRQTSSPVTAYHAAFLEETDGLSLCFDASSHTGPKKSVVNGRVEADENVETNETLEEAPRVEPDQVVKSLLRNGRCFLTCRSGPSTESSERRSA